MNKRTSAAALSVALIGGTALGASVLGPWVAGAQSTTSTTAEQSAPTPAAPVPTSPAEMPDDIKAEMTTRLNEHLQSLVDDGTITAAQRDAVVAKLLEGGPIRMGGPMGEGGHGPRRGFHLFGRSDVLTTTLGVTDAELRDALADGKSIADIAASKNVPVQTLIDALVKEATDHLAEEVTEGDLTQAEADAMKAELTTRITEMVNGDLSTPPMGRGEGRFFGPDGPRRGEAESTTSTTGA